MRGRDQGRGEEAGLKREKELINFLPLKTENLLESGRGLYRGFKVML